MSQAHNEFGNPTGHQREVRVIHLMIPGVIQIPGDVSVGEAARLMQKEQAPCLLIKDTDHRVGIMTHSDIVFKVVARGINPDEIQSRRVMSRPVRTIEFDQPVEQVKSVMATTGASLVVVTRHKQPVGILTAQDLLTSPRQQDSHIHATVKVYNEKPEGVGLPAIITQLSHQGAFIDTNAPLSPGAQVTLEFLLPGSSRPLAVEATVLPGSRSGDKRASSPPPQGGSAIQFNNVSLAGQTQISAWIVHALSKKSGNS